MTQVGDDEFARKPVGSGQFAFVSRTPDSEIKSVRYDKYFRAREQAGTPRLPYVANLVQSIRPDDQARLAALEAGEIDIAWDVDPTLVKAFEGKKGFRTVYSDDATTACIQFNTVLDKDPVTGAATREALLARLEMVGSLAPAMPLSFVAVHLEGGESERAELLRAVAGRVRELTRPTDAVGRLDHETIGVVLQGTGATAAGPVAARLAHHLNHMAGAPRGFSVTVSAATGTGVNAATLPAAALDSFAGACG